MSPEIQAEPRHARRDTDVRVRLRERRFNAATAAIGCASEIARSKLIGVDERTIRRARGGVIGEVFIARTIAALQRHASELAEIGMRPIFDEVFEVVSTGE